MTDLEAGSARHGTIRVTTATLLVGLALMAGWVLRGAVRFERTEPPSTLVPPDTGAAPPTARGDTGHVGPDEAAAAPPGAPPEPTVASSGLVIPVAGVEPGDLVDTYSAARGEGRTHDAIDILAPRGTPVLAAAAGRVARLFYSDRGGRTVYILTGPDGRTVHYYAHLEAYAPGLEAGRDVRAGEVIGSVGDSGNAAPGNTHLHFAIWRVADTRSFWAGAPVNPYPLLAGRTN